MAGPVSDRFGLHVWFITAGVLIFCSLIFALTSKEVMRVDDGPDKRKISRMQAIK